MKKLIVVFCVLIPILLVAQSNREYLRFGDVKHTWYTQSGSIDNVTFEIKPRGAFAEVGMYFDFSTRGTSYVEGDSLEIQMMFDLPERTEVTDMWLWVGTTIVQADVYDKWTGSKIYEDIVARRVDPAILYKYRYCYYYGGGCDEYYLFKIFPLMTNLPRKAKMTFLVPINDLNSPTPSITLPFNILKLSAKPILNTTIKIFPENSLIAPVLLENQSLQFIPFSDPDNGDGYSVDISDISTYTSLNLTFSNPKYNGVFASTYNDPSTNEKYFQMQAIPADIFNLQNSRKVLMLLDFIDANCTQYTDKQLLNTLKFQLHRLLKDGDSFNLMFSGNFTRIIGNNWISADSVSIETTFASLQTSYFNSSSNLPILLADGINFIQNHKNEGSIILVASSKSHGDNVQANNLLDDLTNAMGNNLIQIHVSDLFDYNYNNAYHRIGSQYYYGNGYLYANLSMLTKGDFSTIMNDRFENTLPLMFSKTGKYFRYFDLYAKPETGFTYSRYYLGNYSGIVYYDQPVQMVGKYNGSGRFRVSLNAESSNGQIYSFDKLLDYSQMTITDSITKTLWGAQYLRDLAQNNTSNQFISIIVEQSKKYRVLTDYTAFLALEPAQGPLPAEETDGGTTTDLANNSKSAEINVQIYPNPFNDYAQIAITLNSATKITAEVYDIFGKRVNVIVNEYKQAGYYNFSFNSSDLAAGTYILKVSTDNGKVYTYKMMLTR
jgi:hypothetical protein